MQVEKKVSLHSDVVEVKQGNFLSIQYLRLMSYLLFLISGSVSSFTLPAFKFLKNEGKTKYDAIYVTEQPGSEHRKSEVFVISMSIFCLVCTQCFDIVASV